MNKTPSIHLASPCFEKIRQFSVFSYGAGWLLFSFLVVGVVREVVKVVFDGHEQAGEPPAAAQLGGEDHAGDHVVCGRVGRWDSPQ